MSVYHEGIATKSDLEDFMRKNLLAIMAAIRRERDFQDKKYGTVLELRADDVHGFEQGPGGHDLGGWLIVIEKELDEAKDALIHGGSKRAMGRNSIRAELIQIAAVAVAALEQHGLGEDR
jgi:hypothetical protein